MGDAQHWEDVYGSKAVDQVSWYAPHLERSIELIEATGLGPDAAVIDVGGGASTLVDDLLGRGFDDVTVLDLSSRALAVSRARLGAAAERVTWLTGDVTRVELPEARYDLWHDRAVFHFLTDPEARRRYVERVLHAVKPGGFVIVATFGPHGPEQCSGLDVVRYDAEGLHSQFGAAWFDKLDSRMESHRTPRGTVQEFVYCLCRRDGTGDAG